MKNGMIHRVKYWEVFATALYSTAGGKQVNQSPDIGYE
jgi:hypothetical protein